jgi:phasin family protein
MAATLQQQVSAATRSQIENQLAAWTALNNTLLEGVARLADLNMQAVRESIDESAALSRELAETKNPQDLLAVAAEQMQPRLERLANYGRHVADIANDVRTGFGKVMQEEMSGVNQHTSFAMNDMFRQAPVVGGPFGEWMKTAMDAANAGYEQLLGTTMQMTKTMEDNIAATGQTNGRARKK